MEKKRKGYRFLFLLMGFLLVGCRRTEPVSKTAMKLNTVVTITIYESSLKNQEEEEALLEKCMDVIDSYEEIFSRTDPESELNRLNQQTLEKNTDGYMRVSDDLFRLLQDGKQWEENSHHFFSIGMEPLTSLWNFTGEKASLPAEEAITEACHRVQNCDIRLREPNLVYLEKGAGIDLGAMAKGYIGECLKEYLQKAQVKSAVISLGGNIVLVGDKGGSPFTVGIKKPFGQNEEVMGAVYAKDCAVVSSGIYERYFEQDGRLYHHVLNPFTGYPFENDLAGVTVICKDSYLADIVSTVALSMGSEEALQFFNSRDDLDGCVILKDGSMEFSQGFEKKYGYRKK